MKLIDLGPFADAFEVADNRHIWPAVVAVRHLFNKASVIPSTDGVENSPD